MKYPVLARLFVKNYKDTADISVREKYTLVGGVFGIICNLILFLIKMLAGVITNSVSVIADAFNNLSDTGSSIVTMLGVRISSKPADKDHPFGHGRAEYMSTFIVAALILMVGFELLKSSISKIINPEPIAFSPLAAAILVASVVIKLVMYFVNRSLAAPINSDALRATAQDSINDSISTAAVLISFILAHYFDIQLDGFVGLGVSVFILISGFKTAKDALDPLLGTPPAREVVCEIEKIILEKEDFLGIHDLIVHNYGPGRMFASVHVEVPCTVDIVKCHEEIDLCEKEIADKTGVQTVIHMDPIETDNPTLDAVKSEIQKRLFGIDERLTLHDFRMTPKTDNQTNLIFDVVVPDDLASTIPALREKIAGIAKEIDHTYCCVITFDSDFTG